MAVAINPTLEPLVVTALALSAGWDSQNPIDRDSAAYRLAGHLRPLNENQCYVARRLIDRGVSEAFVREALRRAHDEPAQPVVLSTAIPPTSRSRFSWFGALVAFAGGYYLGETRPTKWIYGTAAGLLGGYLAGKARV